MQSSCVFLYTENITSQQIQSREELAGMCDLCRFEDNTSCLPSEDHGYEKQLVGLAGT